MALQQAARLADTTGTAPGSPGPPAARGARRCGPARRAPRPPRARAPNDPTSPGAARRPSPARPPPTMMQSRRRSAGPGSVIRRDRTSGPGGPYPVVAAGRDRGLELRAEGTGHLDERPRSGRQRPVAVPGDRDLPLGHRRPHREHRDALVAEVRREQRHQRRGHPRTRRAPAPSRCRPIGRRPQIDALRPQVVVGPLRR